jgi:hypothetical protein
MEVGGDRNDLQTAFGPTNVAIHRVTVAVELGDAGDALHRGNEVDVSGLPDEFSERRSSLLIELARAYGQAPGKGVRLWYICWKRRGFRPRRSVTTSLFEECWDFLMRGGKFRTPGLWPLAQRLGVLN